MTTITASRSSFAFLGRRAAAYFVDTALIYGAIGLTQVGVLGALGITPAPSADGLAWECYILATITLPVIAYWSLTESSARQATLGKRWLGLQVTDQAGKRLPFGQALLRAVVKFLPFEIGHIAMMLPNPVWQDAQSSLRPAHMIMFALLALYALVFAATGGRRGVPDLAARTRVTERDG